MKAQKSQQGHIGTVTLRTTYRVTRDADTFHVSSANTRGADFGQSIEGQLIRYLAHALQGQTVTVPEAQSALLKSGIKLRYTYGYKLRFFAQYALIVLVATGNASHRRVGRSFEYHIA